MRFVASICVLLAGLLLSGCETVNALAGDLLASAPKPTARLAGGGLKSLDARGVDLMLDVEVDNPYAAALPVSGLDWALALGGSETPLLRGALADAPAIAARSKTTIPVPVRLEFAEALAAGSGLRPGQVVDWAADIGLSLDPPGAASPLRIPLRQEGQLPIPAPPAVEVEGLDWQKLSLSGAEGVLSLKMTNANEFAASLQSMAANFELNGVSLFEGGVESALDLGPGESGALRIPFAVRTANLGPAALGILSARNAEYDLSGVVDLRTPFGPLEQGFARSGGISPSR